MLVEVFLSYYKEGFKITFISLLRDDSLNNSKANPITLYAQTELPLRCGDFDLRVFRRAGEDLEQLLISKGDLYNLENPFLRVHSECFTGEVLGSLRCDCKSQMDQALEIIEREGEGLLIYLRNQEGRGIGLGNKIRAYELQRTEHLDTIDANLALGFPEDLRSFLPAVEILQYFKINSVRLNTNNMDKVAALRSSGIEVTERIPALSEATCHNAAYLRTKLQRMGHRLEASFKS